MIWRWYWHLSLLAAVGLAEPCVRADMVRISEIHVQPTPGQPAYVVLENLTATPFDLAGWRVSGGFVWEFPAFSVTNAAASFLGAHERIVVSAASETDARALLTLPAGTRLFGPWRGRLQSSEWITVRDKNGALVASAKPGGRSDRRQAGEERQPSADIVINEIMYDPPAQPPGVEFVELFNRGTSGVNVAGWAFDKGIRFRLPDGTRISAGGFLVVAADAARLRAVYGELPLVGDFSGKLDNDGEWIRLVDAQGNLVDEVEFKNGGDWPQDARGDGSSLELIHPAMDNNRPSAWRASDESGKARAGHYAVTNVYREANPIGAPTDHRELHLYLAGRGHVVLENVALWSGGSNVLASTARVSTNGSGAGGWLCQGTHWASFVNNGQLHLVSDGRGDDCANRIEIDAPGLRPGELCALHFDARWVSGTPRLVAATWDRSLAHSFRLPVPPNLGTPGRPNSRASAQPPPQVDGVSHRPAVPRSTDPVTVTARVFSAAPLASVVVFHRLDSFAGEGAWHVTPMVAASHRGGEAAASDRLYVGKLDNPRVSGQVVQFFVRAVTADGGSAEWPRGGAERPALFVVDDRPLPPGLRTVRLVVSARDLDALARGDTKAHGFRFPRLSNHRFNAAFVVNDTEVIYGAGLRQNGSALTRDAELRKFQVRLPPDRPFRGRTRFVYDDDAAEGRAYHNRVARYLLYLLGGPAHENEFVRLVVNAGPPCWREDVEPIDEEFLDRHFARGRQGELYRIQEDWRFLDNWEGVQQDADWRAPGLEEASTWRHQWAKRTRKAEDDFSGLLGLFQALARTNAPPGELEAVLDVPATLQVAAVRGFLGDWDSFTMQRGRNAYLYRRPGDGKFQLLNWDNDEAFLTGQPLYGERLEPLLATPAHRRLFHAYVLELVRLCSREPERVGAWLAAEREANGGKVFQATYLPFFKSRAAEVLQAMEGKESLPFLVHPVPAAAISGQGQNAALSGQAPYGVARIVVQGHPEADVQWTADVRWSAVGIKLASGEQGLVVQAQDGHGRVLGEQKVPLPARTASTRPTASLGREGAR